MKNFPPAVLRACAANISKIASNHGRSTRQIVRSVNQNGDNPDESCNQFNFIAIGKQTLDLSLTDVEKAFLAAFGFIYSMNDAGFECYLESPEADWWPMLRHVLAVAAPYNLQVFDKVIGITGCNFSTDRQVRMTQLRDGGESVLLELEKLEVEYDRKPYPTALDIERFMTSQDVIVISDEELQLATEILAKYGEQN